MRLRVASFAAILRQDMGWLDSTENSTGQADSTVVKIHCKKRLAIFPSPAGMSLTRLSLARNN
jgi:hypothetical protein